MVAKASSFGMGVAPDMIDSALGVDLLSGSASRSACGWGRCTQFAAPIAHPCVCDSMRPELAVRRSVRCVPVSGGGRPHEAPARPTPSSTVPSGRWSPSLQKHTSASGLGQRVEQDR